MDLSERIVEALSQVDEDGNDLFAPDDVRHALPYLVVTLDVPLDELSEGLQELVADTMSAAGADTGDDPVGALRAYYEKRPVDPLILDAVRKAFEGGDAPSLDKKAATA